MTIDVSSRERRRSPRYETAIDGDLVSSRGSKAAIRITDLSTGGFSMTLGHQSFMDSIGYAVKFAGLERLGAELCWAGRREAGFRFERPLHPAVLDHVIKANPLSEEDADNAAVAAVR